MNWDCREIVYDEHHLSGASPPSPNRVATSLISEFYEQPLLVADVLPHTHALDEIWIVHRGVLTAIVEGEKVQIEGGHSLRLPAGTVHAAPLSGDSAFEGTAYLLDSGVRGIPLTTVVDDDNRLYSPQRLFLENRLLTMLRADRYTLDVGVRPYADYRRAFDPGNYVSLDRDPAVAPDVVGDICAAPFEDASFDQVLLNGVLESLADPHRAIAEVVRVLRPAGVLLLGAPFRAEWVRAREAVYEDLWRFSPDGMRRLLENSFEIASLFPVGDRYVYAIAQRKV